MNTSEEAFVLSTYLNFGEKGGGGLGEKLFLSFLTSRVLKLLEQNLNGLRFQTLRSKIRKDGTIRHGNYVICFKQPPYWLVHQEFLN